MTDDLESTVGHGAEGPSEDRDDTSPVASTIPSQTNEKTAFLGSGRVISCVCCTTVLHTAPSEPSKLTVRSNSCSARACCTNLLHTPFKPTLLTSQWRPPGLTKNPPGLIVRGRVFHLRVRVPRTHQDRIGRTHVWRSLGTGLKSEAVRRARLVLRSTRSLPKIAAYAGANCDRFSRRLWLLD